MEVTMERVSLSFKLRGSHGVTVIHYGYNANRFWFDYHLANFFFS